MALAAIPSSPSRLHHAHLLSSPAMSSPDRETAGKELAADTGCVSDGPKNAPKRYQKEFRALMETREPTGGELPGELESKELGDGALEQELSTTADEESEDEQEDEALFYRKRFREYSVSGPAPVPVPMSQDKLTQLC